MHLKERKDKKRRTPEKEKLSNGVIKEGHWSNEVGSSCGWSAVVSAGYSRPRSAVARVAEGS